jgi:cell fate regulator YaaT (PSP1 superfamily)
MPTIVGVRLRSMTRPQFYEVGEPLPAAGDHVIVKTDRGLEYGEVAVAPQEPDESTGTGPFNPIERVANAEDLHTAEQLAEREREAMRTYRELVKERGLDMKPIDAEFLFDGSRVTFYFVAEERVDFRDLVRDLAAKFHARIDMRQVGVRDEARMVGGLGHCGEQLCCTRFGGEFQPVSIRMAKEQDLPLNPLKISGLCGRLMCCLRYEFEAYKDFKGRAPKRNAIIELPDGGKGKVIELNTPKEQVTMLLEGGGRMTVPLAAMDCGKGEGCNCPCRVRAELLPHAEENALLAAEAALEVAPTIVTADDKQPRGEGGGGGGGRRKRRRGGGGGGGEAPAPTVEAGGRKAEPRQPRPPRQQRQQPAQAAQGTAPAAGEAPASGEAGAPGTGRRRRRRRSTGGGGQAASKPE